MEALQYSITKHSNILDEGLIVNSCQSFDSKAQEILYNQYADQMYQTCFRYLSDQHEAEDTVVEGFVKVFSKIGSFEYRGKGSLAGWIKRIMINECLMKLRKKKYEKVQIDNVSFQLTNDVPIDDPILEEEIVNIIKKLPKGYRTVFNMYVIEGYSHKEIAKKLNISENTSKSQLSKARASLSKSLIRVGAI